MFGHDSGKVNTRRQFLKAGGVLAASSLAGCLGEGSGGETATTAAGTATGSPGMEPTQVNMTTHPFGLTGIILDQMIKATDRLTGRLESAGYTLNAKQAWENAALFAAGGPDLVDINGLEAAIIATERDLDLAVNAQISTNFPGWITRTGSEYDPEEVGGLETAVQNLANSGKVAIGSWGGGEIPPEQIVLKDRFGLNFFQDDNDFETFTADFLALPKLAAQEEADAVSIAPHYGATKFFASDPPELTKVFWNVDQLSEMGYGRPMLNGWTCTQEFADQNPEAVEATVKAWHETVADFHSRPMEIINSKDKYMQSIAAGNEQQAQWVVDFAVNEKYSLHDKVLFEQNTFTDSIIGEKEKYYDRAAELGVVSSDWNDRLEFRKVPQE